MATISDSQLLIWFCYACGIIYLIVFIPMRLMDRSKESAKKKHDHISTLADRITRPDARNTAQTREDLMKFLADYFEISPAKLKPDASFIDDLRISSGELEQCLESIGENLGMTIDHSNIHKVGDLLKLIERTQG